MPTFYSIGIVTIPQVTGRSMLIKLTPNWLPRFSLTILRAYSRNPLRRTLMRTYILIIIARPEFELTTFGFDPKVVRFSYKSGYFPIIGYVFRLEIKNPTLLVFPLSLKWSYEQVFMLKPMYFGTYRTHICLVLSSLKVLFKVCRYIIKTIHCCFLSSHKMLCT